MYSRPTFNKFQIFSLISKKNGDGGKQKRAEIYLEAIYEKLEQDMNNELISIEILVRKYITTTVQLQEAV